MGAHPREGSAEGLRVRPFCSHLWTYCARAQPPAHKLSGCLAIAAVYVTPAETSEPRLPHGLPALRVNAAADQRTHSHAE